MLAMSNVDLMLTDLKMEPMDGLTLLRRALELRDGVCGMVSKDSSGCLRSSSRLTPVSDTRLAESSDTRLGHPSRAVSRACPPHLTVTRGWRGARCGGASGRPGYRPPRGP
jgi:hypothetical protein